MDINAIENELRKLGYGRIDNIPFEIGSRSIISDDFSEKSLKQAFFDNCSFEKTNFDFAAVTGSTYKKCKFNDCSMHQPDFQFCNFYECEFVIKKPVVSSFNNCNFIESKFVGTAFESCTFTGALFENCEFRNVSIRNSTLENALFSKCLFVDMDLRNLNMDFVQIDDPTMLNVVLPFSQIPYMFGCLQHIIRTNNSVRIASQDDRTISSQEYIDTAIPLLIQYWTFKSKRQPEFFFPLANVYISTNDYLHAAESLKDGLVHAAATRDFRMIKFYCKLISKCNYSPDATQKFYNIINRFASEADINSLEMRSFMRNIGEIKNILFSSDKRPILKFLFRTNTSVIDSESVGRILGKLFAITKMKGSSIPNNVELMLSENSPLMISLQVSGDENNIITLLPALFVIAKMVPNEIRRFMPIYQETASMSEILVLEHDLILQAKKIAADCTALGIELALAEYHIINCASAHSLGIIAYYFDGHNEFKNWNPETFLLTN